jgi:hypothetical protein
MRRRTRQTLSDTSSSSDSNWTWYATEGSEEDGDFVFFGYVCGFENEFGYFRLSELQAARGPLGLPIERDLYFKPAPLSKLQQDGWPRQI